MEPIEKITDLDAANSLISGIEKEIVENFIGKAKLLKFLIRITPGIAKKIINGINYKMTTKNRQSLHIKAIKISLFMFLDKFMFPEVPCVT